MRRCERGRGERSKSSVRKTVRQMPCAPTGTSHDDIRRMVKTCTDLYGPIDVVDYNVGLALLEASWNCPKRSGTGYSP
jgi:hypothetical protein